MRYQIVDSKVNKSYHMAEVRLCCESGVFYIFGSYPPAAGLTIMHFSESPLDGMIEKEWVKHQNDSGFSMRLDSLIPHEDMEAVNSAEDVYRHPEREFYKAYCILLYLLRGEKADVNRFMEEIKGKYLDKDIEVPEIK